MNYAKAFRILRAAFGLTQSELAGRLNIGASQLSLIEAGRRQPSHKTIASISLTLGVPIPLISLLATDSNDPEIQFDGELAELSKLLLHLLVSSDDESQQPELPFSRSNEKA